MERRFDYATNKHHANWQKSQFRRNTLLNKLRTYHGFIIPMNLLDHRELHAAIPVPVTPTPDQAERILAHLGPYDSQSERLEYIDQTIDFIREDNPRYAEHLRQQRGFVLMSPYTKLEAETSSLERYLIERENYEPVCQRPISTDPIRITS